MTAATRDRPSGGPADRDPDGRPWQERAAELADRLAAGCGHLGDTTLADPAWRAAYDAVPRHRFIPDAIWAPRREPGLHALNRTDPADAHYWWDVVYGDHLVIVQVDDGRPHTPGAVGTRGTSSASQPSFVFAMLGALEVGDGMRVLEIGTGTGWNAALLAARLGGDAVVSVEIDPDLAAAARARLRHCAEVPRVVTADGVDGWPDGAPYDRVIATAAVTTVPRAWLRQTRPGGLVLTPFATGFHDGVLLRLRVDADGTACGPVVMDAPFMPLRAHRADPAAACPADDGGQTTATLLPSTLSDPDTAFALGLLLPGVRLTVGADPHDDQHRRHRLWLAADDGSWATTTWTDDGPPDACVVDQFGARDLWTEVEAAHRTYQAAGCPARTRFGVTVGADGCHPWVDTPENRWPG